MINTTGHCQGEQGKHGEQIVASEATDRLSGRGWRGKTRVEIQL
jgi:hypothetical protein